MKLQIIRSPQLPEIIIENIVSPYCRNDEVCLLPEGFNMTHATQLKNETKKWKTKYESILKGLYYWKNRAKK